MARDVSQTSSYMRGWQAFGVTGREPTVRRTGKVTSRPVVGEQITPPPGFWSKVDKDGPVPEYRPDLGPCWLWTAASSKGYGHSWRPDERRLDKAHRVAYEAVIGPIPEGLELDHLCRVRSCVNPRHLEAVTHAENIRRGMTGKYQRPPTTHCPHGHEYTEENSRWNKTSGRQCRECALIRGREQYRLRKAVGE